jgi:hypothetical protein
MQRTRLLTTPACPADTRKILQMPLKAWAVLCEYRGPAIVRVASCLRTSLVVVRGNTKSFLTGNPEMSATLQLTPHMDAAGLQCFRESMQQCRCYLEYGSGGSTVYAATVAEPPAIISVESDKAWIEKVRNAIGQAHSKLYLEYCDIGEVGNWGAPKNDGRITDYWKYAATPWEIAQRLDLVPDTILIDGRFRVASFLLSLVSARIGTRILFDDYLDRPHYFIAERFCPVAETRGRMAVFVAARNYSVADICQRIAEFSVLPNC